MLINNSNTFYIVFDSHFEVLPDTALRRRLAGRAADSDLGHGARRAAAAQARFCSPFSPLFAPPGILRYLPQLPVCPTAQFIRFPSFQTVRACSAVAMPQLTPQLTPDLTPRLTPAVRSGDVLLSFDGVPIASDGTVRATAARPPRRHRTAAAALAAGLSQTVPQDATMRKRAALRRPNLKTLAPLSPRNAASRSRRASPSGRAAARPMLQLHAEHCCRNGAFGPAALLRAAARIAAAAAVRIY